ncbi:hypothetical protein AVEN_74244-1 [Araneus ventricosus]|uniref:Uncharacterized protein n=1 Tax=Araneus ventricosus TaxID=182803 RepID=A0A4Y2EVK5_ARAVE|nr:hypothetical protein AVEN_74244-1 [Araneus ventricosus]
MMAEPSGWWYGLWAYRTFSVMGYSHVLGGRGRTGCAGGAAYCVFGQAFVMRRRICIQEDSSSKTSICGKPSSYSISGRAAEIHCSLECRYLSNLNSIRLIILAELLTSLQNTRSDYNTSHNLLSQSQIELLYFTRQKEVPHDIRRYPMTSGTSVNYNQEIKVSGLARVSGNCPLHLLTVISFFRPPQPNQWLRSRRWLKRRSIFLPIGIGSFIWLQKEM